MIIKRMKWLPFLLLCVGFNAFTQAQPLSIAYPEYPPDKNKPVYYKLHGINELYYFVPGATLMIIDYFLQPDVLTVEGLAQLSPSDIPAFERNIIYFDTVAAHRADIWTDGLNAGSFLMSGAVILSTYKDDYALLTTAVVYAEGALLTLGITEVLKSAVSRERPYAYNTDLPDAYRLQKDPTSSFPSGHTSSTTYNCFFAARMLNDYYIKNDNKLLSAIVWSTAATYPLVTGYLRTAAGNHFYTDVLAGYVIGASIGLLNPSLHIYKIHTLSMINGNYKGMRLNYTF
jgi:membrane-associated phospholipid phosphatase